MNPILYEKTATSFTSLGIGVLSDAVSCTVTEARNGAYELKMKYPVTGRFYSDIQPSAIIKAVPAFGKDEEVFRIYKVSRPMKGIVTVEAEHISYQLSFIPVTPFTASSAAEAFTKIKANSAETNNFTFWTDKTTTANMKVEEPVSARSALGGVAGSIIDTYGGELEFVGTTVKLWNNRGSDRGVTLRYGKNITDIKQEETIANTITGIMPFWKNENEIVMLPEQVIRSANAGNFPYNRTIPKDFSSDFQEKPTVDQLRTAANSYISQNGIGVPDVSMDVSFVVLSQMEEYKDMPLLEAVNLCDTVTVIFDSLGINTKAKVVKTVWDVIGEQYEKVSIGTVRANLSNTINEVKKETTEAINGTKSELEKAIIDVTEKITGESGGYVVFDRDADNNITQILIMDTDDKDTATNVWRWNKNGLAHSSTGYDGTYTTAIMQDGTIVADFVKSGTLEGVTVNATLGSIGGWKIAEREIYQIVDDPDNANQKKKVSLRPPSNAVDQWILSIQYSTDGGTTWYGSFYIRQDGAVYSRVDDDFDNFTITSGANKIIISPKHLRIMETKVNGASSLFTPYTLQFNDSLNGRSAFSAGGISCTNTNGKNVQVHPTELSFSDGAEYPAEMQTSGSWKYKKLGKNLYEIYGNVRHLGRNFNAQYGSVYYTSEAATLPNEIVTKDDVDAGKVYVYEMDVSTEVPSGTGIYYASIIDVSGVPNTNNARIHYYLASAAPQTNIDITAHIHMLFSVSD